MSNELDDFLKLIAEAKEQDPKYQQIKQVKQNVQSDLGSLFEQLGTAVAEDPKKKLIDSVKQNVKTDLNSLFEQLNSVTFEPIIEESAEQKIDELVQEIQIIEAVEATLEESKQEPKTPEERQDSVDQYIKSLPKNSHPFQQPEVDTTKRDLKAVTDKLKFLEQWVAKISAAGPGGGEVNLRWLDDVDRSTIADGKYLNYNATTKKFQFTTISGGTPQVQSDWTQTDSADPSYIKNKPTVVTDITSVDNTVQISNVNGVHDLSVAASLSTSVDKVFAYVTNDDSVTIHKGDPVYLYRATGNRPSVILAKNTSDQYSAKTLGLASQDINPGNPGWVQTQGVLTGVNTQMYAEGDTLYLGETSGTLTNVKPSSPNHLVYIGVVVRANQGQGQIYIRPQNGYELEELHNVNIDHLVTLQNGDYLKWSVSDNQWVNAHFPTNVSTFTNDSNYVTSSGLNTILGSFVNNASLNTTLGNYASISYVDTRFTNLIGAAPAALDTLKEIADQLASDESVVSSLTTTVAGKVSLTGSYADPTWITSLAYSKLTGVPTALSAFTNDSGYLTSASAGALTGTTLKSTVVNSSLTSVGTLANLTVAGGASPTAGVESTHYLNVGSYGHMFDDGNFHIHAKVGDLWLNSLESGRYIQLNTQGYGAGVKLGGDVISTTPFQGKSPFNSALNTEVVVDNIKYRIANSGGIFPQIISNTSGTVDVCWSIVGVVSGAGTTSNENSGTLVANNAWTTLYSTHGMDTRGDNLVAHITDNNAGRIYRATFMVTNNSSNTTGYNIIVERIV